VQAAQAWFQAERARLEIYTRDQFLRIRQHHQEALAKHYEREAVLARREREVQREVQFLTAQAEALRERARGLAEWEAALKAPADQQPHAEGDSGQLSEAAARAKYDAIEAMLRERQAVWEEKQAEVLARQEQMERRYRELEQREEALTRRMAELDALDDEVLTPKAQRKRQEEMERRYRELQRAEEDLGRRMMELAELENELGAPPPRVPGETDLALDALHQATRDITAMSRVPYTGDPRLARRS
jgi:hypothetical protein